MNTRGRRFIMMFVALAAITSMIFGTGCAPDKVHVGYEGLLVKLTGGDRGVQESTVVTGRVLVNNFTEELIEMPTFSKVYPFSADDRPGSPKDEALRGSDKNGTQFIADWSLSGYIVPGMSPYIYRKYKMSEFDDILHGPVRMQAEAWFNRITATMMISDIVGAGRNDIVRYMNTVARDSMQYVVIDGVRHQVFVWERIEFITSPRPTSADVVKSIEDITSAKNEYLSNVTKARGDSAMRVISAIGIDEANKIMNRSLTPLLVEYEKAKNWRPVAIGSSAIVQTK